MVHDTQENRFDKMPGVVSQLIEVNSRFPFAQVQLEDA